MRSWRRSKYRLTKIGIHSCYNLCYSFDNILKILAFFFIILTINNKCKTSFDKIRTTLICWQERLSSFNAAVILITNILCHISVAVKVYSSLTYLF